MKKNQDLKKIYENAFRKGEQKHFTPLLIEGKNPEFGEVLQEISWKGKKVLDVGCGTGYLSYLIAKKGASVVGIDYSKEALKIAKVKFNHPNLSFKQLDLTKNIRGKYDVIVSLGTLEHQDNPFYVLKKFKKQLNPGGRMIITSPNWTNPRGYMLMTLNLLFNAPVTLADLHYLTPIDFINWARKLNMNLKWKTIDRSWAHGEILIKDFKRRIPKVLADANLPNHKTKIRNFLKWINQKVLPLDNTLPHSGAIGLYIFTQKHTKNSNFNLHRI